MQPRARSRLGFNRRDAIGFAGVVSGAGALTQAGANTVALTGTNTYTSGTTINRGGLMIGSDTNLGATAGGLRLNGGARSPGAGAAANSTTTATISRSAGRPTGARPCGFGPRSRRAASPVQSRSYAGCSRNNLARPTAPTLGCPCASETPPAERARCDWAEIGRCPQPDGPTIQVYAFIMVLGFSRYLYAEFTRSMDAAPLIRCPQNTFAGDTALASTALDRLLHRAPVVNLTGESYLRKKKQSQRPVPGLDRLTPPSHASTHPPNSTTRPPSATGCPPAPA